MLQQIRSSRKKPWLTTRKKSSSSSLPTYIMPRIHFKHKYPRFIGPNINTKSYYTSNFTLNRENEASNEGVISEFVSFITYKLESTNNELSENNITLDQLKQLLIQNLLIESPDGKFGEYFQPPLDSLHLLVDTLNRSFIKNNLKSRFFLIDDSYVFGDTYVTAYNAAQTIEGDVTQGDMAQGDVTNYFPYLLYVDTNTRVYMNTIAEYVFTEKSLFSGTRITAYSDQTNTNDTHNGFLRWLLHSENILRPQWT